MSPTKVCRDCDEAKPRDQFRKHPETKDRLHTYCSPCDNARRRANKAKADPESRERRKQTTRSWYYENQERYRDTYLTRVYGISLAEYNALLESQGGKCGLCRIDEPGGFGSWHVDHDHDSGAVRGLLCQRCNIGLGYFKDDPDVLRAAADYIEGNRA